MCEQHLIAIGVHLLVVEVVVASFLEVGIRRPRSYEDAHREKFFGF
jgi:hypothetical protein